MDYFEIQLEKTSDIFCMMILSDSVGEDVAEKRQKIIDEKQMKIRITALINDTVGTLMTCRK